MSPIRCRRRTPALVVLAVSLGLACVTGAAADTSRTPPSSGRLGQVHFEVDCNAAAQREFNLAMAYYHSFAWSVLGSQIDRVLQVDPNCGMAHWARVLASLDNPFVWPGIISAKALADGPTGLDTARRTGLKSQREQDYVDALAVFFKDADTTSHRVRAQALEQALGELARRYPDDIEAAILHALVLSANFDPADKHYTNQLKAAAILEPLFAAHPEHPGVAHYLIHSYDYPPIAARGLEAARRYSRIAPDAPHALHMPAHIFTRVGAWKESVQANTASARADTSQGINTLHAYDYMVYAHLQLGQAAAARKVMEQAFAIEKKTDHFVAAYAYAAIPARLLLERGAWAEAASLQLRPTSDRYPWHKYPQAEAIHAFARGVGAARSRDAAQAAAEVSRLQALHDSARAMKLDYWADQIDIQASVVRALAHLASGARDEGLAALREAATREDATEKHVVTPGPLLPARELLATALLEAGRPADALREFEAVLVKEPNRLRAVAGAAQAAHRSGQTDKARRWSTVLRELTAAADAPLPDHQLVGQTPSYRVDEPLQCGA